jgi:hypothetical protein
MSSKDEILATFQILTTIDDVELAILQLQESNWNLMDAVNKAVSAELTAPTAPIAPTTPTAPTAPERPPAVPQGCRKMGIIYPPLVGIGLTDRPGTSDTPDFGIPVPGVLGVADRPPQATKGQQPPFPIQQGLEPASPAILIDDSSTISIETNKSKKIR